VSCVAEATQSAKHGVKVASQRIFRSACLSRGDVDHVDVAKSLLYLKEFVQVKTMIDFRYYSHPFSLLLPLRVTSPHIHFLLCVCGVYVVCVSW
jgi:hypothetical protein